MKRGDYDRLVSRRIFVFKVIGLIMSVGGGLSVGSEGPLVHTAGDDRALCLLSVCGSFLMSNRLSYHLINCPVVIPSTSPLYHYYTIPYLSACIAHLLMKYVIWFDEVLDSPSLTKQIMAASAAVGVSRYK